MKRSEQLVQYHLRVDRPRASHAPGRDHEQRGETRHANALQRLTRWGVAAAVGSALAFSISPAAAAPCQSHRGEAKTTCLEHRAKQAYPAKPTWSDFKTRATAYEYATLHRIAQCEMGTGPKVKGSPWRVKWGVLYGTYSSAFGIWNGNFATTRAITGYPWPTSVPAEEAFHALALARKYGFSAWGCF